MTWQTGRSAGDLSCENSPTVFISAPKEEREGERARYFGLMPSIDVR